MINYVRIPVAFSLLLLLAFFPLILGLSEPEYHRASGLTTQPYLWRWLAVTGVLFAGSAVLYALRCRRMHPQARKHAARTRDQQAPRPASRHPRPPNSRAPRPANSGRPQPAASRRPHRRDVVPPPAAPLPASTSGTRSAPPSPPTRSDP